jgi:hypothetical protein
VKAKGEPLTRKQIEAICRRAFGPEAGLLGMEQFRGGTHNQVYRLTVPGQLPLILRVAPPDDSGLAWDERDLMRREQAIRPAFAALAGLAPLMPRVVFEDFSREVIDRDYMLQTFIEGHRWEDMAEQLEPEEALGLWRAFGGLLRQIHDTAGPYFGDPPPGQSFPHWSEAVEYRLARTIERLRGLSLDDAAETLAGVQALARGRRLLVDEVAVPRLLHGDLWRGLWACWTPTAPGGATPWQTGRCLCWPSWTHLSWPRAWQHFGRATAGPGRSTREAWPSGPHCMKRCTSARRWPMRRGRGMRTRWRGAGASCLRRPRGWPTRAN